MYNRDLVNVEAEMEVRRIGYWNMEEPQESGEARAKKDEGDGTSKRRSGTVVAVKSEQWQSP